MSEWLRMQMEKLNEYQKAAVLTSAKSAVVNANVGSGKTTVLITRMVHLHEVMGIPYGQMLVLTFTNKAAGEMKERIRLADPGILEEELSYMGTFHGIALKLLKGELSHALNASYPGWNQEFSVITPEDEMELVTELITDHKLKIKYKNRLRKRMEQLALHDEKKDNHSDQFLDLMDLLKKTKQERNLMSFSDLMEVSISLLEKQEENIWHPAYILVDEAQDCDARQLSFLQCMMKKDTGFFAVGDPNQTIYSFRGSKETTMFSLKRMYDATEYSLPVNYRSSPEILEAASRFMQSGKKLIASQESGNHIYIKNHYDPFQEADHIAHTIQTLITKKEVSSLKEIAVFYRLQEQAELLEKVMEKAGIPCHVAVKKTIADIPVLDFVIQVLKFACNTKDDTALKRMMTDPVYGPGYKGKRANAWLAERPRGCEPLYDRAKEFLCYFKGADKVTAEDLYEYFFFLQYLNPTASTYEKDRMYVMNFFYKMLEGFQVDEKKEFTEYVREFLDQTALYSTRFLEEEKDAVWLMTLHASKGLEFDVVFMIGINQGLVPLWGKSIADEEEERRLFFVGMTRARKRLEISYYTNPSRQGVAPGPGSFLQMIPGHLVDWKEKKSMEDKKAHLNELRKAVEKRKTETETEQEVKKKRVRHPRYGIGIVVEEDDLMVTAEFENYGKKQLMKMMTEFLE